MVVGLGLSGHIFIAFTREKCTSLKRIRPYGPYPQYGLDFPEEIPAKLRKDPLRVRLGSPKFKAFEASRAFPELSVWRLAQRPYNHSNN